MSRIVRPNHRLGGDYTCIPACTHEHTFVSDGGGGVGIGVLHCFLTHFMTRTIARLDFVKVARGVTEVMLGRVICLFRICMIWKYAGNFFRGALCLKQTQIHTHACVRTHAHTPPDK